MEIVLAYVISLVLGHPLGGVVMMLIYKTIGHERPFSTWLVFWVGTAERGAATTLVIWAPGMLPAFIGGWIVLKVAANWQRRPGAEYSDRHLIALWEV